MQPRQQARDNLLSDVLRSGFQKADEGDPAVLVNLGLTLPLIRKIQNSPLRKRNRFCDLSGHYLGKLLYQELGTVPCQERLAEILLYVDKEERDEALHDDLLRQGATAPMMRYAFGMTKDEFTARRKMLKIADTGGRPRRASHHQEAAILKSWSKSAGLSSLSYAQRFLIVVKETQLDLRTIWPIIRPVLELKTQHPRQAASTNNLINLQPGLPRPIAQQVQEDFRDKEGKESRMNKLSNPGTEVIELPCYITGNR